jgi:hypothetical protein
METLDHSVSETGRTSLRRLARNPRLFPDVVWILVVLAQLVLIWAFPRVPTQDGPVHVASAIAFRDLNEPGTSYGALFERRLEPFPNWTSHLLLAGLTRVLEASVAEKALVSFWFILWPLGAWRLARVLGADRGAITGVALLMAFGRAFWLGFYNFLLGVALALLVVAWVEARRDSRTARDMILCMGFFLALFFTHLGAWVLAAVLVVAIASVSADRARRLRRLVAGLAPSLVLVGVFVSQAGVLESAGLRRALRGLTGPDGSPTSGGALASLRLEWFGGHAGLSGTALTVATLAVLAALIVGAVIVAFSARDDSGAAARHVVLVIGGCGILAFALGPDDLGAHAGYLRARLALVAPLLLVAGLAAIRQKALRFGVPAALLVLNIWNLACVASFLPVANRDLEEFTAAADVVGHGKTLVLVGEESQGRAFDYINPNLYCLGTGNAVATNYQAGTRHFPLRYRPGVRRAAREMSSRTRPIWTDVALLWDVAEPRPRGLTSDYVEAYRRGRLRVFTRRDESPGGEPRVLQ